MTANKSMLGPRLSVQRDAVFSLLKQLAVDNETYFLASSTSAYGIRLSECCREISLSADLIQELVRQMHAVAHKCDYDENTPGNGFRSLICVCDMAVLQLISILRVCSENRGNLMFRVSHQCKEIEGFAAVLRFLILAFQQVVDALDSFDGDSLFPPLEGDYQQYNMVLRSIEGLDTSCFYARPLGFQFAPSVTRTFRVIGFVLATYSLSWEKKQGTLGSLVTSSKYLLNPEQRALRIVKVIRESDIEFCKGFWNLSELGAMCNFFDTSCAISEMREIPLCGPIPLQKTNGEYCVIPEPSSHTGVRPVRYRVISAAARVGLCPGGRVPSSSNLVIHCHGGGYVATSSKSHESYLRDWARDLNCPVISIDYSLAPENPYPRPMEEVLYAYAYILNNPEKFGWTGEKIVMCGDSAGGNLVVCTTLNLIQMKAKRLPDGLVPIYTPFLFQYLPSPSRVLSFMDPLLHMGVVIRCAAAYTNVKVGDEKPDTGDSVQNTAVTNGHKSLFEYVDQVQKSQQFNVSEMFDSPIVSLVNLRNPLRTVEKVAVPNGEEGIQRVNSHVFENPSEETEDPEDDMDTTTQTVQIAGDPASIYLSANNYDSCLIDYLQIHPLTKNSLHVNSDINGVGKLNVLNDGNTVLHTNNILNDDPNDDVFVPATPVKNGSEDGFETLPVSASGTKPKPQLSRKKRSLSQSLADTAALAAGHAYDNISGWFETPGTPIGFNDKQKLSRSATLTPQMAAKIQQEESKNTDSSFASLLKLNLPRDPLISPMYASKDVLVQLPPVWFVACHLDPLLDDTVMFARKLRAAGGRVQRVDLLDSIPHGFLNFTLVSPDCLEGSKLCISRIREALGIPITN
ncbi:hypothetical protein FO519_000218 [Halicephalobus sp. NKZ332]|nr:hypothetical protein FO519_000218 [Halicephalobus sp. NKZ332]